MGYSKSLFCLFVVSVSFYTQAIALDMRDGVKAAENMEKIIFAVNPNMKNLISYVDVHIRDGHLIIMVKEPLLHADRSIRDEVFHAIKNLWQKTKYVREMGYAGWVEAKFWDSVKLKKIIVGKYQ